MARVRGPAALWRSPLWRRAPLVLRHHRSALAAVAVAGFLVALSASSAPFVTTASASAELKSNLAELSPLATGLEVEAVTSATGSTAALVARADARERGLRALATRLGLHAPVFTLESTSIAPFSVTTALGDERVLLMARSGVLAHVRIVARTSGRGVWISDFTARDAHVRPGGILRLGTVTQGSSSRLALRVKGVYRALDSSPPGPYWANFLPEIFPRGADPPPPARYVFMGRDELLRAAGSLQTVRTARFGGRVSRTRTGIQLTSTAEMAVSPHGLTLARARSLARRFGLLRHQLKGSVLGGTLGCNGPRLLVSTGNPPRQRCTVTSSLSSAVALANRDASEISPAVSLLSAAGTAIALAVAAAAGVFLVRRRSSEAALLYARGEHPASFAARTGLEVLLPAALGAAAGFAVALAVTGTFAPSGSVDGGTVSAALARAGLAAAAAVALAAGAAAILFARRFDSGTGRLRRITRVPWELPLGAAGLWLLHQVLTGHGLARSGASAAGHPTLEVFVFGLLLAAAAAGLVIRALRPALRRGRDSTARWRIAPFLAVRRLSASPGVLTALFVVSAVAFGAYFYAATLAGSLERSVAEKAYIAYGGDVQGLGSGLPLPRRFPYPLTELRYSNQAVTLGGAGGTPADVLAVDPTTLGPVLRWYGDWGPDPRPGLDRLDAGPDGVLPAIAAGPVPAGTGAAWFAGTRIPVQLVARVSAFPGMSPGTPLLVVSSRTLERLARRAHLYEPIGEPQTYLWAKGPPDAVARALERPAVGAYFVTTVDAFTRNPDVVLARRTFTYMRMIALAAGVLVFTGLLLYLQARQRSQAVGSALAARMGLTGTAETLSLALELAAIASAAAVVGGAVAVAAAAPIVRHLDPLPDSAPPPPLVLPWGAVLAAAAALLVIGLAAGALTSRVSRRTDMSEALRVA